MKKVCVTGDKIQVGDILSGVWFFPGGYGEVISLRLYQGTESLMEFAGRGSQVATLKDCDRTITLPACNWYNVMRNTQ